MTHHITILPDPLRVKLPGRRAQTLAAAVVRDGRVVAVFESETTADAFCRRLNQLERERLRA